MRVAIVGGPGVGKSTLVRQLGDLYHNGSYGEGEKGVWEPRVLMDIEAGVNAVGLVTDPKTSGPGAERPDEEGKEGAQTGEAS